MSWQQEQDKKDAKRYRFLRNEAQYSGNVACLSLLNSHGHKPAIVAEEDLDEAVDRDLAVYESENGDFE